MTTQLNHDDFMIEDLTPDGIEDVKVGDKYWKPSEMEQGKNRFRIVKKAITGYEEWIDNKPYRYRGKDKPISADPDKPPKPFFMFYVWDYARSDLFILEFAQSSLVKTFKNLILSDKHKQYTSYDFELYRNGFKKQSKYILSPLDPSPMDEEIIEAVRRNPVRLEAVFSGKNPWRDLTPEIEEVRAAPITPVTQATRSSKTIENLKEKLKKDNLEVEKLDEYLKILAKKNGITQQQAIDSWLISPKIYQMTTEKYINYLTA